MQAVITHAQEYYYIIVTENGWHYYYSLSCGLCLCICNVGVFWPQALCACEAWTLITKICNTLDMFHWRCTWKIQAASTLHDHVTNEELMQSSEMQSLQW